MPANTDEVRRKRPLPGALDRFDRRILGLLVADAGASYAALGAAVGLSPAAVHERVKRLRAAGVLRGTVARLDGPAVGKPLLSFVLVTVAGWGKSQRMLQLERFPEVEEIHSVAGDAGVILKLRTRDPQALEDLLHQLYALPGVTGSRSYIVLQSYLERPVQAEVTETWPKLALPE